MQLDVFSINFIVRSGKVKRVLSSFASEFKSMTSEQLKESIIASEGRVIVGETVVSADPLFEGLTNAEVMASFGADLVLLNAFDVFERTVGGLDEVENPIEEIKKLTGRPVGINLEPVDQSAKVLGSKEEVPKGRTAAEEAFKKADDLGIDFLLLTGNPSTGVTNKSIKEAISIGKKHFSGLIIAGKMHGAGVSEDIINEKELLGYLDEGADGVLLPTVGTVPGVTETSAHKAIKAIKETNNQAIIIGSIGTSQESADEDTIREFGLSNKRVGVDIHHIGDGGYGRMAIPENIMKLGITVRGKRHTYFRMAQSVNR